VHFDLDAVFNRQKTWTVTRSLGTRILRLNRETELAKTVQKFPKKIREGGSHDRLPDLTFSFNFYSLLLLTTNYCDIYIPITACTFVAAIQ